jgi:hypothetical protein
LQRGERGEVRAAAAGVCEEAGDDEQSRGEESREQEQERGAAAGGGGGAAGGDDGHACVAPRHRSKRFVIKDESQTRMSAPGSGAIDAETEPSKKRRSEELLTMAEGSERDDLVIVSYTGADSAAEEMEADALTMCFSRHSMSVRNFVCVADCAAKPIFIGYHTDKTRDNTHYVKKMIPSTNWLKDVNCDVMMLIGHGSPADERSATPGCISFCDFPGVDVDGVRREILPNATTIWSCSSLYKKNDGYYEKPPDGVTLSEVVHGSKLVMMLCCAAESIAEEYASDNSLSTRKPDLLIFKKKTGCIHDTSINVFLALLMTCIEENYGSHTGSYDASIK